MSRDIVLEQLAILDRLFPTAQTTAVKRPKPECDGASSAASSVSVATDAATASASTSLAAPAAVPAVAAAKPATNTQRPLSQSDQLAAYRARHSTSAAQQQRAAQTTAGSASGAASTAAAAAGSAAANPHARPPPKNIGDYISVVRPRGQMAAKLAAAAPYNFFLTTITAEPVTHAEPLSVTFQGECCF